MKILPLFFDILLKFVELLRKKLDNNFLRILKKIIINLNSKMIYVVEENNWAIENVGLNIVKNLNLKSLIRAEISAPLFNIKKIIHFGSINSYMKIDKILRVNKSNKVIVTWYHIVETDNRLKFINLLDKNLDILHTTNRFVKEKLIDLGLNSKKIVIIPLGVDLSRFKKYDEIKVKELKKKFNLPEDKFIIGSFQKDGIGWDEGLKPKLVKGPDILCEVLKRISEKLNIHVFLSGPARGFVKRKLEEYNISYTHIFLNDYDDIADCYNVLDLYIITSRAEGGPLSLLEGMATGVPIISTRVGMVPDIIKHGINGYLADIENVEALYNYSIKVLKNEIIKKKFISNGLKDIQNYDWEIITKEYYIKIYKKLRNNL